MQDSINKEVRKHLLEVLNSKRIEIIKDFSENLMYEDYIECYYDPTIDYCSGVSPTTEKKGCSPFYRINQVCIVENDNNASLIVYKSFLIKNNETISFIQDDITYILKDMDQHLFERGARYGYWDGYYIRQLDVFIKDNTLYGYTHLNRKYRQMSVPGNILTKPSDCYMHFYSFDSMTLYENEIVTGKEDEYGEYHKYNDYVALQSNVYYKVEKEIANIELVDTSNSGWIGEPDIDAFIFTFTDGTKKLLVINEKGKKFTSKYYNDLELEIPAVNITKKQFEQEKQENKQSCCWESSDTLYIPGLTFNYSSSNNEGKLIVKNNGHMRVKSKKQKSR